jgi:hypothetical protein
LVITAWFSWGVYQHLRPRNRSRAAVVAATIATAFIILPASFLLTNELVHLINHP